ncbi:DUF6776 family protein [Thiohalomonas denitrificans]|uniref:Uncharacterized protein n=1 Tax=Thiohalomonas denitrificans TaxID=415747 RepID=A0A1G5PQR6_9GAMM|nr:DUF6776 family protein [Thiohalomonas denitrificans]SCZ51551.1 hypothetical protein SAMN03097708_00520 [Thiohalomonas denitrificans]
MTHVVVRPRSPWRVRLFIVIALTATLLSGWGLFEYGRYKGGFDATAVAEERRELQDISATRMAENRRLREQMAVLKRTRDIEKEAYRELEGTVAELQDELLEIKQELAFYRGIVSPRDGREGLKLQDFELVAGPSAQRWHYKLVLTQVRKNDNVAAGAIRMQLEGAMNGKAAKLELSEVDSQDRKALAFRFKYFQDFEGNFELPEGFKPRRVLIVIDPSGKGYKRFERTFDWPAEEI